MSSKRQHAPRTQEQRYREEQLDTIMEGVFVMGIAVVIIGGILWAAIWLGITLANAPEQPERELVQVCTQTSETTEICRDKWIEVEDNE
jgi:hypothetical protein